MSKQEVLNIRNLIYVETDVGKTWKSYINLISERKNIMFGNSQLTISIIKSKCMIPRCLERKKL
jgi:hypothetical protein